MLMPLTGAWPLSSGCDSRVDTLSPSPIAPRGEQPLFANRIASTGTKLHFLVLRLIRVAKLGAEREAECREEGLGPSSAFAPSLSRTGIDGIDTRASLTPGRRSGDVTTSAPALLASSSQRGLRPSTRPSPLKLVMSIVPRLRAQKDEIIALLREQNEVVRRGRPEAVARESKSPG